MNIEFAKNLHSINNVINSINMCDYLAFPTPIIELMFDYCTMEELLDFDINMNTHRPYFSRRHGGYMSDLNQHVDQDRMIAGLCIGIKPIGAINSSTMKPYSDSVRYLIYQVLNCHSSLRVMQTELYLHNEAYVMQIVRSMESSCKDDPDMSEIFSELFKIAINTSSDHVGHFLLSQSGLITPTWDLFMKGLVNEMRQTVLAMMSLLPAVTLTEKDIPQMCLDAIRVPEVILSLLDRDDLQQCLGFKFDLELMILRNVPMHILEAVLIHERARLYNVDEALGCLYSQHTCDIKMLANLLILLGGSVTTGLVGAVRGHNSAYIPYLVSMCSEITEPLREAIRRNHHSYIELFLASGKPYDVSLVMFTAAMNEQCRDLILKSLSGSVAIFYGAKYGIMSMVQEEGNINYVDPTTTYTPLYVAVVNNHTKIIEYLVKRGANPHKPIHGGGTAYDYVMGSGKPNLIRFFKRAYGIKT